MASEPSEPAGAPRRARHTRDASGRVTSTRDRGGRETWTRYDASGRVVGHGAGEPPAPDEPPGAPPDEPHSVG